MRTILAPTIVFTILIAFSSVATATPIDLVFVLDDGESMSADASTVISGIGTIAQGISAENDVQFSLVTFDATPTLQVPAASSYLVINNALDNIAFTGVGQNGSLAASLATQVPFRDGSARIAILISDGNNDGTSSQTNQAIADMIGNQVHFMAITQSPVASYTDMALATGSVDESGNPDVYQLLDTNTYTAVANRVNAIGAAVPEPSTALLLGLGLLGIGVVRKQRSQV